MLRIYLESNSNIIYLFIALVSSAGPLELALVAFFFLAFKLAFKGLLEVVLKVELVVTDLVLSALQLLREDIQEVVNSIKLVKL